MKKILNFSLVFFIFITNGMFAFLLVFSYSKNKCLNVKSEQIYRKNYSLNLKNDKINSININFCYNNKTYNVNDFYNNNITKQQSSIINSGIENRINVLNFAINNGFSKYEAVIYAFPEILKIIEEVENKYCFKPTNAQLKSYKNTGKIYIEKENSGLKLDLNSLIDEFYLKLINNKNNFNVNLRFLEIFSIRNDKYFTDKTHLRGSFKTKFSSSSDSRKNNIKTAMDSLDGCVIESGEVFSFNKCTGKRDEKNGYLKAKTIKNGSFYEEFGGGVCQVSTTLYNAAVLSDLEIMEVNPHSLPVSYIEPCFDAMVNEGSSDLVIKNNTESPIIIACSNVNDECLINIYGIKNDYEIKRVGKKLEEIENYKHEEVFDYKCVGLDKPLNKGERLVISYGKNGYKAEGSLEYYKNKVLVKTKKIRNNTYYPTKEVVLVG